MNNKLLLDSHKPTDYLYILLPQHSHIYYSFYSSSLFLEGLPNETDFACIYAIYQFGGI